MVSSQEIHAQTGAYALGALDDRERRAFERHLRRCEACRQEVRGLVETTALLGSAAAEQPPEGLRTQVLREIGHTRQLPPLTSAGGRDPVRGRGPAHRAWARGATIAAAACLIIAVALGVVAVRQHNRADDLSARQQHIAAVLSAPDARVETGKDTPYGTGMLIVSHDRRKLLFALTRPSPLPKSRTYQLWFLSSSGHARSAGLVDTSDYGSRYLITGTPAAAAKVALTVEPAGGSKQPTTTPIMQLPLS